MSAYAGPASSRADALRLDDADPLSYLRDRFVFPDRDIIYLDGNSLGVQPKATLAGVQAAMDSWGRDQILGWRHWIHLPEELGDLIAAQVVEARPGEVVVSDSTSVNLYKLVLAAIGARPGRHTILTDDENFPTDRYIVQGIAAERGLRVRLIHADPIEGIDPEIVASSVDEETALVTLSHIAYRSGALADMRRINEHAHAAGALVLWDISHSAGSVEVPLESTGTDLAVGCTYKYLNAGPGSPAFLYVRDGLDALKSPVWGWYGHRNQFAMGATFEPAGTIKRFLVGAPPILSMIGIEHGAKLIGEAGINRLQAKGAALTELVIAMTDRLLGSFGFSVVSPRDPTRRGSHVSLQHVRAKEVVRTLIRDAAVITDYRPPDRIRLAPVPLTTRFVDVWDAMNRLLMVAKGLH